MWLDKAVLIHLRIHGYFGIELITIPTIITGIMYGPFFVFFFGFIIVPFIGGLSELTHGLSLRPFRWDGLL